MANAYVHDTQDSHMAGVAFESADTSPEVARTALRQACKDLSDRGLIMASRWAAELLQSVPASSPGPSTEPPAIRTSTPNRPRPSLPGLPPNISIAPGGGPSSPTHDISYDFEPASTSTSKAMDPLDALELDQYIMGKAYYDNKELDRAAKALKECRSNRARWIESDVAEQAGERRVQEESGAMLGPKDRQRRQSKETIPLLAELKDVTDPFLLYLKGLVLDKLGKRLEAIDVLTQSGAAYPYNWSCWLKIASLIDRGDELAAIDNRLPNSFMSAIFSVHAVLEIHSATEALQTRISTLLKFFPTSLHLKAQQALISYHLREFDDAERYFDEIFEMDPFRIDDIDTYSNILYVMEKRSKLSQLAQKYTQLDRFRPETCCLVGNYYSLRGDHEKAVVYFRRALRLDRGYLSAWTLMGHEYVEMKNTHAAVEAYRRAVDVSRKDYRAWYGLGQTYELLEMHYYALNYYQKATALRPYDSRMWAALGSCYDKLGHLAESTKAYKRALLSSEPGEMSLYTKLCALLERQGLHSQAAAYQRVAIDAAIKDGLPLKEYGKNYLSLAHYEIELKDEEGNKVGDLVMAERYLSILLNSPSTLDEKDEAKSLMTHLREAQLLGID